MPTRPRTPTHGYLMFNGRQWRVTPGAVQACQTAPDGTSATFITMILLAEGYSAAELLAAARETPPARAQQLPLFDDAQPSLFRANQHPWAPERR